MCTLKQLADIPIPSILTTCRISALRFSSPPSIWNKFCNSPTWLKILRHGSFKTCYRRHACLSLPSGLILLSIDISPTHFSINLTKKLITKFDSYALTEGTVEYAIHEWEERFKQRRLHKMWIVQGVRHSSANTMRGVCLRVERSVRVCKRQMFD